MYFIHPQLKLSDLKRVNLPQKLAGYFPGQKFAFTDMGRSAFKVVIEQLKLQNSEIIMPAYICDVLYPILKHYNIKPIFIDTDLKTFQLKTEDIARNISLQTKAILVCHTYGLSADIERIKEITGNIPIIEDGAHYFGGQYRGNIAFYSLYKQFPALRGGLLVCPAGWQVKLPKTSASFREVISFLNYFPFFAFLFKKVGRSFGNLADQMVRKEKMSEPAGLNIISQNLFASSLISFERSLENRKKIARLFQIELKKLGFSVQEGEENVFCFLSALVPSDLREKRDMIVEHMRRYNVFCTRIWHTPIVLNKEVQKEYGLDSKNFPQTVEIAQRVINFPLQSHYQEKDVKKMIKALTKTLKSI
jgi:dTDP-4-amino-4,6-dideoxygalactose transaminase